MRRLLISFMLVLLPFQFVWGAAAGYCQHEDGAATSHFGHHAHKHQAKSLKSTAESTSGEKTSLGGDDPDCSACHLSCAHPVMTTVAIVDAHPGRGLVADVRRVHAPQMPCTIERPNWTLAA